MNVFNTLSLYFSDYFRHSQNKLKLILFVIASAAFAIGESIILPRTISLLAENKTFIYIKYLIILFIIMICVGMVRNYLEITIINTMTESSRAKFFTAIVKKYKENYKDIEIGNYVSRIISATRSLKEFTQNVIRRLFPYTLILVCIVTYFFTLDIKCGIVGSIGLFYIFLITMTIGNYVRQTKIKVEYNFFEMFDDLNDKYANLLNTYINNKSKAEMKNIRDRQRKYKNLEVNYGKTDMIFNVTLFSGISIISTVLLYYMCHANKLLLVILSIIYITTLFAFIRDISPSIAILAVGEGSYHFLNKLIDTKHTNLKALPNQNLDIHIDNLRFSYNKQKPLLKNINLHIASNQNVALIGKSGSGKTTLMKLLMKLHPYEGTIRLNGEDIQKISTQSLRQRVVYINQRTDLSNKTVLENMKYGINGTSDFKIIQLLKTYQLHDVFSHLPKRLHEKCKVGGKNLSLGMQKIIVIVRGILRAKNANIVIFDEPLAGLDKRTRKKVMKMIQHVCKNKTCIIITHDYEIKSIVDRVINFNQLSQ